jgi:polyisoprenoid-binding protein YceI
MKMTTRWLSAAVLAVLSLGAVGMMATAGAQRGIEPVTPAGTPPLPQIFHINPSRSSVTFHADGDAGTVKGEFRLKPSSLQFFDSGIMTGQIVVSAASESSDDHVRDKQIRSQVLQAAQFGQITFAPTRYEGTLTRTGDSTIQVHGVLTLLGKPHEAVATVDVHSNGFETSAKAHLVGPSAEWGLDPAALGGAKEIAVDVQLVGYVTPRN